MRSERVSRAMNKKGVKRASSEFSINSNLLFRHVDRIRLMSAYAGSYVVWPIASIGTSVKRWWARRGWFCPFYTVTRDSKIMGTACAIVSNWLRHPKREFSINVLNLVYKGITHVRPKQIHCLILTSNTGSINSKSQTPNSSPVNITSSPR